MVGKINFGKFKKVHSDNDSTTFKHPEGHTIVVSHKALSPKMRGEVAALPTQKFDEGGIAEDNDPRPAQYNQRVEYYQTTGGMSAHDAAAQAAKDLQQKKSKSQNYVTGGAIAQAAADQKDREASPEYAQTGDAIQNNYDEPTADFPKKSKHSTPKENYAQMQAGRTMSKPEAEAASQNHAKGGEVKNFAEASTSDQPKAEPDTADKIVQDAGGPAPYTAKDQSSAFDPASIGKSVGAALREVGKTAGEGAAMIAAPPTGIAYQAGKGLLQGIAGPPDDSSQVPPAVAPTVQPNQANQAPQVPPPDAGPQPGDTEYNKMMQGQGSVSGNTPSVPKQLPDAQALVNKYDPDAPPGAMNADPQKMLPVVQAANKMTFDSVLAEHNSIVNYLNAVAAQKPETMDSIYQSKGFLGKMGMIAGMALGGADAGLNGGPNKFAGMLQNEINNSLVKQQQNLSNGQTLLAHNLQLFNNLPDAINFTRANMQDQQLKMVTDMAAKFPQNQKTQAMAQQLGMMGAKSTNNALVNASLGQAYRHYADHIENPAMKIQLNPYLQPDQKNEALKQLGIQQGMNTTRNNLMNSIDKINSWSWAYKQSPAGKQAIDAMLEPDTATVTKDTEGRVTPQDVGMIKSAIMPTMLPNALGGKDVRAIQRDQVNKIFDQRMNFPMLDIAGINYRAPKVALTPTAPKQSGK